MMMIAVLLNSFVLTKLTVFCLKKHVTDILVPAITDIMGRNLFMFAMK